MARTNIRRGDRGSGAEHINRERAIDEALNEQRRIKKESGLSGINTIKRSTSDHERDASEKQSGRKNHPNDNR